jgi:Dolichyl-phosphate-mannose-protein mannosyltransferase
MSISPLQMIGSQQIAVADPSDLIAARNPIRLYVAAIGILIGVRFVAAALLPLYFGDEPYYWHWSRNLAWGYFDHPPAVAFLIRAGTTLFGDTELGVRFFGLALSIPATMCVWRTGTLLLGGSENGGCAALFFNLTLMVHAVTILATPDAALLACSAAFIWASAEAVASKNGYWWLAAGLFAGFGLLAKFTILFIGAGVFFWLVVTPSGRHWLATPWPWLGGLIAAIVFSPNVLWNLFQDSGGALGFQFSRLGFSGRGRWYYLPQFVGEQFILASPFILVLAMVGLWRATVSNDEHRFLIPALIWPLVVFFVFYVFVDRVHRNWPDVIYPALAIAAADAFRSAGSKFIRRAAVPVASAMLAICYAQVLLRPISLAPYDQLDHHLASNMRQRALPIAQAISAADARGILTTDFPVTSWLRFYLRPQVPIIMIADDYRFPTAPRPTAEHFDGTLIYVALKDDMMYVPKKGFSRIEQLKGLPTPFLIYRVSGFKGEPYGRIP